MSRSHREQGAGDDHRGLHGDGLVEQRSGGGLGEAEQADDDAEDERTEGGGDEEDAGDGVEEAGDGVKDAGGGDRRLKATMPVICGEGVR